MWKKGARAQGKKNSWWAWLVVGIVSVTFLLLVFLNHQVAHHEGSQGQSAVEHNDKLGKLTLSRPSTFAEASLPMIRKQVNEQQTSASISPVALPHFGLEHREYVFSSLIERSSLHSLELYATTFMLGHAFLRLPDIKARFVDPKFKDVWIKAAQHFVKTKYLPSGRRDYPNGERYTCRIRHTDSSESYTVVGDFIPNRGSVSNGANRRVDILRCPIAVSDVATLSSYIEGDERSYIELYAGSNPVISFYVPWKARMTGFALDTVEAADKTSPWEGLVVEDARSSNQTISSAATPVRTHLCMPCMKKAISRNNLPLILEFIAHHLNVGFDHISFAYGYSFKSSHMNHLLFLLNDYINENKVSIRSLTSTADDENAPLFMLDGMQFFRVFMTSLQSSLCLYRSKGLYDYMMVLDNDEMLIPRFKLHPPAATLNHLLAMNFHTDMDISKKMDMFSQKLRQGKWQPATGWADGHRHPTCFVSMKPQIFLQTRKSIKRAPDSGPTWLGEEFKHGPEINSTMEYVLSRETVLSTIVPVQNIFFMGNKYPGACVVDWSWNGCKNKEVSICLEPNGVSDSTASLSDMVHTFDEKVTNMDGRFTNDALIYHFRYYETAAAASSSAMKATNLYRKMWFEDAKNDLIQRGFELILSLPVGNSEPTKAGGTKKLVEPSDYDLWHGTDDVEAEEDGETEVVMESLATSLSEVVKLPRFSSDLTELVMSSLIERTAETDDLTITTFMLCHYIARLQENLNQQVILRIHPKAVNTWNQAIANFLKTQYRLPGKRVPEDTFACRIRNVMHLEAGGYKTLDGPLYVKGRLVPSSATVDHNANYRAEILRCLLPSEESVKYVKYSGNSSVSVEVELIKNNKALIKFQVPYDSRITGYMSFSTKSLSDWQDINDNYAVEQQELVEKSSHEDSISSISSIGVLQNEQHKEVTMSMHEHLLSQQIYAMSPLTINPWKGKDGTMDKVYMCVPGWRSSPSREFLGHLLEFIQHHLSLGIQHIFLGVTFAWKSPHMMRLMRVLKPFMDQGKLSIASHTADNLDYRFTLAGTVIRNTPIKVYSVNLCLYYAKGMADYVAIWDVDEFFVLNNPKYKSIVDLIEDVDSIEVPANPYIGKSMAVINATYKTSKGMADNHAHPLCYIQLYSSTLYQVDHHINDPRHESIWFRDNFMHSAMQTDELSHKKGIHPTRRSFSLNLHTGGACALPFEYTDCSINSPDMKLVLYEDHGGQRQCYGGLRTLRKDMQRTHNFDEPPQLLDAKNVDRSDAEVYHVQFFRRSRVVSNDSMAENHHETKHKYASDYSAKVLADLDDLDLYMPLTFLNDDSFVQNTLHAVAESKPAPVSGKVVDVPAIVLLASKMVTRKQKILSVFVSNISALSVSKHNFAGATLPKTIVHNKLADQLTSAALPGAIANRCAIKGVTVTKCQVKTDSGVADMLGTLEMADEQAGLFTITCSAPGSVATHGVDTDVMIDLQATACNDSVEFHVSFRLNSNESHPYRENVGTASMFREVSHKSVVASAGDADNIGSELLSTVVDFEPNRFSVALVSEYLVHHYLLGVKHITIPVNAKYSSSFMNIWANVFKHFIVSGRLTLVPVLHHGYLLRDKAVIYQVVRAITTASAQQRSSRQLLEWGFNFFYIPGSFPNKYPVSDFTAFFSATDTDIEVLTLSADDYIENSLAYQTMQYRLFQGEIYTSSPKASGLRQAVTQLDQIERSRQGEISSQKHAEGVLYEVWAVDTSGLNCVRVNSVAPDSQMHRFCMHLKNKRSGSSHPEYKETSDSNVTTTYNAYHSMYFSHVYTHLVKENLDLFIDSIEVISAEMNPTYKVGDGGFPTYRAVYEQNPLVEKKPPMIRVSNKTDEAPKKSKLAGVATVPYRRMLPVLPSQVRQRVGGF